MGGGGSAGGEGRSVEGGGSVGGEGEVCVEGFLNNCPRLPY